MKIAAASFATPFHPSQRKLLVPEAATPMEPMHAKELLRAAGLVVAKNVTGTAVAGTAWKLTTIPHTMTQQELATVLSHNNIAPDKASLFSTDIRQLLSNPLVRTVLVGISGGAVAYLIVEKTSWSRRAKWLTSIGVGLGCAGLFLLLRHLGYMR